MKKLHIQIADDTKEEIETDIFVSGPIGNESGFKPWNTNALLKNNVKTICSLEQNFFLFTRSGEVYSWGLDLPLLGRLVKSTEDNLNPLKIEFGGKIVAFSTGKSHALILDDRNNVYGWGNNNHGQVGIGFNQDNFKLGVGNENSQKKEILLPTLIKGIPNVKFQNVFAVSNGSFLISEEGDTYVFGDVNIYFKLHDFFKNKEGLLGLEKKAKIYLPQKLENPPWGKNDQLKISSTNSNQIFAYNESVEIGSHKDLLKNLKKRNADIEKENHLIKEKLARLEKSTVEYETKLFGKSLSETNQIRTNLNSDKIVVKLETQIKGIKEKIEKIKSKIESNVKEIEHFENEINSVRKQQESLDAKNEELNKQIYMREKKMRACLVENNNELYEKYDSQKTKLTEVFNSNLNMRNMFLLKISEYENFLKKKLSLKEELDLKINELQERNEIFSTLSSERKHKIFINLFSNKEQDTDKAFARIFETFLSIKSLSINKIARKREDISGLKDIINESNSQIELFEFELKHQIPPQNDVNYSIISKVVEILEDNIKMRLLTNELTFALLSQTSEEVEKLYNEKLERSIDNFQTQNEIAQRKLKIIEEKKN